MRHMVQESPGEGGGAALSRKGGRGKRTDEQGESHGGGATAKGEYDAFAQRALSHTPVLHPATWYSTPPRPDPEEPSSSWFTTSDTLSFDLARHSIPEARQLLGRNT